MVAVCRNERLLASEIPRSQVVMVSSYRFRTAAKAQEELLVGHSRKTELIPDVRLESINLFSMLSGLPGSFTSLMLI